MKLLAPHRKWRRRRPSNGRRYLLAAADRCYYYRYLSCYCYTAYLYLRIIWPLRAAAVIFRRPTGVKCALPSICARRRQRPDPNGSNRIPSKDQTQFDSAVAPAEAQMGPKGSSAATKSPETNGCDDGARCVYDTRDDDCDADRDGSGCGGGHDGPGDASACRRLQQSQHQSRLGGQLCSVADNLAPERAPTHKESLDSGCDRNRINFKHTPPSAARCRQRRLAPGALMRRGEAHQWLVRNQAAPSAGPRGRRRYEHQAETSRRGGRCADRSALGSAIAAVAGPITSACSPAESVIAAQVSVEQRKRLGAAEPIESAPTARLAAAVSEPMHRRPMRRDRIRPLFGIRRFACDANGDGAGTSNGAGADDNNARGDDDKCKCIRRIGHRICSVCDRANTDCELECDARGTIEWVVYDCAGSRDVSVPVSVSVSVSAAADRIDCNANCNHKGRRAGQLASATTTTTTTTNSKSCITAAAHSDGGKSLRAHSGVRVSQQCAVMAANSVCGPRHYCRARNGDSAGDGDGNGLCNNDIAADDNCESGFEPNNNSKDESHYRTTDAPIASETIAAADSYPVGVVGRGGGNNKGTGDGLRQQDTSGLSGDRGDFALATRPLSSVAAGRRTRPRGPPAPQQHRRPPRAAGRSSSGLLVAVASMAILSAAVAASPQRQRPQPSDADRAPSIMGPAWYTAAAVQRPSPTAPSYSDSNSRAHSQSYALLGSHDDLQKHEDGSDTGRSRRVGLGGRVRLRDAHTNSSDKIAPAAAAANRSRRDAEPDSSHAFRLNLLPRWQQPTDLTSDRTSTGPRTSAPRKDRSRDESLLARHKCLGGCVNAERDSYDRKSNRRRRRRRAAASDERWRQQLRRRQTVGQLRSAAAIAAASQLYEAQSYNGQSGADRTSNRCPSECQCVWKNGKQSADCSQATVNRLKWSEAASYTNDNDIVVNDDGGGVIDANDGLDDANKRSYNFTTTPTNRTSSTTNSRFEMPLGLDPLLQVLNLSTNPMYTLQEALFVQHDLNNLQRIYLSHCQLQTIHLRAFDNLKLVIELDFSWNKLNYIPVPQMRSMRLLRKLTMRGNPLKVLNETTLAGGLRLVKVKQGFPSERANLAGVAGEAGQGGLYDEALALWETFPGLASRLVAKRRLGGGPAEAAGVGSESSFEQVLARIVNESEEDGDADADDNYGEDDNADDNVIVAASSRRHLEADSPASDSDNDNSFALNLNELGNKRSHRFYSLGSNFVHLQELDFGQCQLHYIKWTTFERLSSLKRLWLDGNKLSQLSGRLVDAIPSGLHQLALEDNLWQCDCRLAPLKRWLTITRTPLSARVECQSAVFGRSTLAAISAAAEQQSSPGAGTIRSHRNLLTPVSDESGEPGDRSWSRLLRDAGDFDERPLSRRKRRKRHHLGAHLRRRHRAAAPQAPTGPEKNSSLMMAATSKAFFDHLELDDFVCAPVATSDGTSAVVASSAAAVSGAGAAGTMVSGSDASKTDPIYSPRRSSVSRGRAGSGGDLKGRLSPNSWTVFNYLRQVLMIGGAGESSSSYSASESVSDSQRQPAGAVAAAESKSQQQEQQQQQQQTGRQFVGASEGDKVTLRCAFLAMQTQSVNVVWLADYGRQHQQQQPQGQATQVTPMTTAQETPLRRQRTGSGGSQSSPVRSRLPPEERLIVLYDSSLHRTSGKRASTHEGAHEEVDAGDRAPTDGWYAGTKEHRDAGDDFRCDDQSHLSNALSFAETELYGGRLLVRESVGECSAASRASDQSNIGQVNSVPSQSSSTSSSSSSLAWPIIKSSELVVRAASSEDSARYKCVALNRAGNSSVEFLLRVESSGADTAPGMTAAAGTLVATAMEPAVHSAADGDPVAAGNKRSFGGGGGGSTALNGLNVRPTATTYSTGGRAHSLASSSATPPVPMSRSQHQHPSGSTLTQADPDSAASGVSVWAKSSTTAFQVAMVVVSLLMFFVIIAFILVCVLIYQIKPQHPNQPSNTHQALIGGSQDSSPQQDRDSGAGPAERSRSTCILKQRPDHNESAAPLQQQQDEWFSAAPEVVAIQQQQQQRQRQMLQQQQQAANCLIVRAPSSLSSGSTTTRAIRIVQQQQQPPMMTTCTMAPPPPATALLLPAPTGCYAAGGAGSALSWNGGEGAV